MPPEMTAGDTHILTLILERLSRIEDRMDADKADASESRRRVHEKMENHGNLLTAVVHRLDVVEKAVESAEPTLKEWRETKAKAVGAGIVGRGLWKVGVWLIGVVAIIYGLRHDISVWWNWLITPK